MTDLLSLTPEELGEALRALDQPAFRAKQLYGWLMRGVPFEEMSNLPAPLRQALRENAYDNPVRIDRVARSQLDGTEKYLYQLPDGNLIEGVLMRYKHGNTLCLSTQVGCKMGCAFCASTIDGCVRSLTAGEMLGQIIAANRRLDGDRVGNVVLMGSGEPLDNYDNVMRFLRLMSDQRGLNMSLRGVSLSTCGLVPKMYDLAEEGLPVTNAYAYDDVLAACRHYVDVTGRRVIFEYALIKNLNSDPACADELARRLRGLQCHVNLIPLNDVKERSLEAPDRRTVDAFLRRLEQRHVSATVRREMGADIEGACGQLRRKVLGGGAAPKGD